MPGGCLPEFYLYAEYEPSGSSASAADDPHIQALLRAYKEEEAAAEQPAAAGGGADVAAAAAAAAGGGGDGGAGGWEGAHWEEDTEADAQAEFQERLRRSPHQCVRYGGEPVWPRATVPKFAPCGWCGAPREPELVLTPGLLSALEEAGAESQAPWLAVMVGTCQAACVPPNPAALAAAEEAVAVVAEL